MKGWHKTAKSYNYKHDFIETVQKKKTDSENLAIHSYQQITGGVKDEGSALSEN